MCTIKLPTLLVVAYGEKIDVITLTDNLALTQTEITVLLGVMEHQHHLTIIVALLHFQNPKPKRLNGFVSKIILRWR